MTITRGTHQPDNVTRLHAFRGRRRETVVKEHRITYRMDVRGPALNFPEGQAFIGTWGQFLQAFTEHLDARHRGDTPIQFSYVGQITRPDPEQSA